ncbi:MAG: Smr/MutS family protein [Proteobacteria bacterium]|nr:Smr/MutS family protein [Pseudomonadota bacterium]
MCAKKNRPPRLLSPAQTRQDDTHLWHAVKESVKPLTRRSEKVLAHAPVPKKTSTSYTLDYAFESEASLPQGPPMARAKPPKIAPQARIDLHGLTQRQAFEEVHQFITKCAEKGLREVLIITGKGLKGAPTPGVLRASLPGWLEDPLLRPMVGSFSQARICHGGSGAFYVFLKKPKPLAL